MNENPYQSPQFTDGPVGINTGSPDDLKSVASAQRTLIAVIGLQIACIAGQVAVPQPYNFIFALGTLAVGLAGAVCVIWLATKVYSTGMAVLLGLLAFVPCVGLLVLLRVNGKATHILRDNGIKVGLMGANADEVDAVVARLSAG